MNCAVLANCLVFPEVREVRSLVLDKKSDVRRTQFRGIRSLVLKFAECSYLHKFSYAIESGTSNPIPLLWIPLKLFLLALSKNKYSYTNLKILCAFLDRPTCSQYLSDLKDMTLQTFLQQIAIIRLKFELNNIVTLVVDFLNLQ